MQDNKKRHQIGRKDKLYDVEKHDVGKMAVFSIVEFKDLF